MRGGEGVLVVEMRMFCTVCLKSSCLLICFHSWSLDLSQTLSLIQTIQILKEEKTAPKPWKNQQKNKHPKKRQKVQSHVLASFCQTWFMGRNFLFLFSRGFCHFCPKVLKTHGKTKKQKVSPHVSCPASQILSMGRNFSRKLAVLAEVALALARNRQAPGPLETLKLSS